MKEYPIYEQREDPGSRLIETTWVSRRSNHYAIAPDSVMVRASASEAGGAGSNPGRVIPKTLKMVPVATLLGAQHS